MMTLESPRDVQVGRYYLVPCAKLKYMGRWLPIIGPLHEDAKFINFPHQHWHYDPRFMSDATLRRCLAFSNGQILTQVLHPLPTDQGLTLKRRKCHRLMPEFPWMHPRWQGNLGRLEDAYATRRVDPERPICPHKGLPLVRSPDSDGVVVCSGHGLSWSLLTGCLVPRAKR